MPHRLPKIVIALVAATIVALISSPALPADPEFLLLQRINAVRQENSLPPLSYAGDDVREVARSYSERMLEQGFFSHRDDHGETAGERLTSSGVEWQAVGENLLEDVGTPSVDVVVAEAVAAWIKSPGHRANILSPRYTETAVGLATSHGRTYLTQLFIAR